MRVHLVCHKVLAAVQDRRARPILQQAFVELKARAERISDPTRRNAFLSQVPHHRELVATWASELGPEAQAAP